MASGACPECGASAEEVSTAVLSGAGFGPRGAESLVTVVRTRCVAGHLLDSEDEEARVTWPD